MLEKKSESGCWINDGTFKQGYFPHMFVLHFNMFLNVPSYICLECVSLEADCLSCSSYIIFELPLLGTFVSFNFHVWISLI